MVSEKMKILKMLEEGRITSEEASRLLESVTEVGGPAPARPAPPPPSPSSYTPPPSSPGYSGQQTPPGHGSARPPHPGYTAPPTGPSGYGQPRDNGRRYPEPYNQPSYQPPRHPGRPPEGPTEDITKRVENFFRDIEPKLQRVTESVVEKTSSVADAISKTFSGPKSPAPSGYGAPPRPSRPAPRPSRPYKPAAPSGKTERNFEKVVASAGSELIIDGLNGQVLLKGYNGDKITAKVYSTAKRGNPSMELMTLGSKYYLSYDENEYESVSIDAYIPESMFDTVRITTNNGAMVIQTLRVVNGRFENANGDIEISGLSAKDLLTETNNGNMKLSGVSAEHAVIEDFNGAINVSDIDIAQLKMSTMNGGINMQISRYANYNEYTWAVDSNNGRVNMILPSSIDIGYHVRANAALSEVRIGLTGLSYIQNSKSFAEAESTNFDQAEKKVTLVLETSNAPLIVN